MRYAKPLLLAVPVFALAACQVGGRTEDQRAMYPALETGAEEGKGTREEALSLRDHGAHGNAKSLVGLQCVGFFNGAGRNVAVMQDVSDPDRLWVGSSTGGLWTSADRGLTWSPVQDRFHPMNVTALAQDPSRPDTLYMCTDRAIFDSLGVQRSDLLRSTDHGLTFHYLPQTGADVLEYVEDIATDPSTPGRIYALANGPGANRHLWRSDDGGLTFQSVFHRTTVDLRDLLVREDGSVRMVRADSVFRSTTGDPGTFLASKVQGAGVILQLAHCRTVPDRMYALSTAPSPSAVHRSDDGGITWTVTDTLVQSIIGKALAVRPDDPDVLIAGQTGMFISHNGGYGFVHWQGLGVDHWQFAFDRFDPTKAFAVYDGGFGEIHTVPFAPYPFDAQFRSDSLLVNQQIYWGDHFPTGTSIIAGRQDIGTAIQFDPSSHITVLGYDGAWCFIHKQDTTVAYASYQSGRIHRDNDIHVPYTSSYVSIMNELDADNNNSIDEGALFIHPFMVLDQNSDVLFFPTKKRLWRSIDRGDSWSPISQPYTAVSTLAISASHQASPQVWWTEGDSVLVHLHGLTAQAGQELRFPSPVPGARFILAHPVQDSTCFVASSTQLWQCRLTAGAQLVSTLLSANFNAGAGIQCMAVDPLDPDHLYIGHDAGLFHTEDGGTSWMREPGLPPVSVHALRLRRADRKLFIFTFGRGAWVADLPAQPTAVPDRSISGLRAAPNPFSESCIIDLPADLQAAVLEVYSMTGARLHQRALTSAGQVRLGGAELPASGTFLLVLRNAEGTMLRCIRLVRMADR
ncbi:MAG: exo-alpha-sialidase [Flavobacteriales bacterium]|nr:exo-alpha-sialidase [Flavobacteriales bacterium]MBK9700923.1 exo-alpha-sialidase [Flavobacteriales bacterium]